ncbi:hypothetical protein LCGC14_0683670 [marine sediment metagenome]|uniref:Uncharacterized protein n=1 Tax=marine sediment metagenome TaxID=412755 RepID=A0A0F9T8W1_9ZZZZ
MRVYEVTDTGRKVIKNVNDGSEELRILNFIDGRGQATEDELEVAPSKEVKTDKGCDSTIIRR